MTIRLLAARGHYPVNAIVTLDAGTEAGLVAAKLAEFNLTGGTPYVAPTLPNQRFDAQIEVDPAGAVVGLVADGKVIAIGGAPVVVSADAPSNADGRPDGTVYIQTS